MITYTFVYPFNLFTNMQQHVKYRMAKFFDWAWVGVITVFTEMVIPFVTPISGYILFMIMAVLADTITGIIAAIKMKQKITSRGIWRTIEKIVIAGIAIMLAQGFQVLYLPDVPLTKGVSAIIAFAELKSNMENYYKITGVDLGAAYLDQVKDRIFPPRQNNKS
jgi:phage-related holin